MVLISSNDWSPCLKRATVLPLNSAVTCMAPAPTGTPSPVIIGCRDGEVLWIDEHDADSRTLRLRPVYRLPRNSFLAAATPMACGLPSQLLITSAAALGVGKHDGTFSMHSTAPCGMDTSSFRAAQVHVATSNDNAREAIVASSYMLSVVDLETNQALGVIDTLTQREESLGVAYVGLASLRRAPVIVAASSNGVITFFDLRNPLNRPACTVEIPNEMVGCMTTTDEDAVIAGCASGRMYVTRGLSTEVEQTFSTGVVRSPIVAVAAVSLQTTLSGHVDGTIVKASYALEAQSSSDAGKQLNIRGLMQSRGLPAAGVPLFVTLSRRSLWAAMLDDAVATVVAVPPLQ